MTSIIRARTPRFMIALAMLTALCAIEAPGAKAADDPLTYEGPDREQKLIEGARREGEVVLYSAMIANQALRPLTDAFSKRYPFIKMTYWRAESAGIFTKLSAEARASKVMADV